MLLREVGYARPSSVEEALGLLAESPGARPLAGGQTLVNVLKARIAALDALIDLNGIDDLKGIELGTDGGLELGAMTTCTDIVESAEARARPILGEVCAQIADVQVRNRGTIGGNLCANDPTNHLPPLMVALGARMTIAGPDGERTVGADDFFLGVYMTAVGPGELLTRITIPPGRRDGFAAVTIGRDGTCVVSAAVSLEGGPRVALGCVAAVPHRATDVEARLGGDVSLAAAQAAAAGLGETLDPPGDVHASSDYRRRVAEVVVARAIVQAGSAVVTAIETSRRIAVEVNGTTYEREVESRRLLVHFIRDDVDLTGTHIGCDTGNCGACSVILDGVLVKSCMLLAVQADGASVRTVEGLASGDELSALQQAFSDHHALQCGYCTTGMLVAATSLLERNPRPSDDEIRKGLQGNLCRCTGYWNIVDAVRAASGQEETA